MAQTTARLLQADEAGVAEAARLILAGRIVAYPTDTVYGLGCNPFDSEAVERLVEAKQRVRGALPILTNSMSVARKLGDFNRTALKLAGRFWPGPVTMVVPSREKLPKQITNESHFVGLRIPKHETALSLVNLCEGRIIGTSANISGSSSVKSADEVMQQMGERIDAILDGGPAPSGRESTVAKVVGTGVEILREGAVPGNEILKALRTG